MKIEKMVEINNLFFEITNKQALRLVTEMLSVNFLGKVMLKWINCSDCQMGIINQKNLFLIQKKGVFCDEVAYLFIEQIQKNELFKKMFSEEMECFDTEIKKNKGGEQVFSINGVSETMVLICEAFEKPENNLNFKKKIGMLNLKDFFHVLTERFFWIEFERVSLKLRVDIIGAQKRYPEYFSKKEIIDLKILKLIKKGETEKVNKLLIERYKSNRALQAECPDMLKELNCFLGKKK